MIITPLFENILIKPLEEAEKTGTGIYLPETAKEKPQKGVIKATGNSKKIKVKVGQRVIYKKWGGSDVKVNGEEWVIVEQKDILAIITNE